ncbi:hypothetical protein vseg_001842 [Gypsophila vaccaria]
MALREAILWAKENHVFHLTVFSDCLQLVLQVNQKSAPHHCIWSVIKDISFLLSSFHCLSITYFPRSHNTCAHRIAKNALRQ